MTDKLSPNFKKSEFRCRDGSDVPPHLSDNLEELVTNLQLLRDYIKKPIRVISGYRTPQYNRKIGGAKRSQHLLAKAADLTVRGIDPADLREIIINLIKEGKLKKGGVGLYKHFVHYDTRGWNARWKGKGMKDYPDSSL